jgi:UPF0755 protein
VSKKSFRIALAVVVGSLLILAIVGITMLNRVRSYPTERKAGSGAEVVVAIEPGMNFPAIAERLHQKGVVDEPRWFRLYAMHRGVTTKVRVGEYKLKDNMTPEEVLDTLIAGVKDVLVDVKIPEGLNMLEAFDLVAKAGVCDRNKLEAAARDPKVLARLGLEGPTADGYLFPETYKLKVPSTAEEVLGKMVQQHRIIWEKVERQHGAEISKLKEKMGWTDRDIITMASIVEKEAVVDAERRTIAQVFMNRLTDPGFKPKLLQTDPTIRYGCEVTPDKDKSDGCKKWDPTQRLRRAQLDDKDNPYNTYTHEGLPPGPICSPGEESLVATVTPDGSSYLYFVAKDDKSHAFARTVAEHERNVQNYLKLNR